MKHLYASFKARLLITLSLLGLLALRAVVTYDFAAGVWVLPLPWLGMAVLLPAAYGVGHLMDRLRDLLRQQRLLEASLRANQEVIQKNWAIAQHLTEVASEIAGGNLERRADEHLEDVMGALAMALNRMASDLRARIREREESRHRILASGTAIRRQVAEQLHGSVQSKLLVLQYRLGKCRDLIQTDPAKAAQQLAEVQAELDRLREEEIRGLSHRLFPSIVQLGVGPSLRFLRDQFEGVLAIALTIDPVVDELDHTESREEAGVAHTVYRVVEEALSNALKHARSQAVSLSAIIRDGVLQVVVSDDGVGYDTALSSAAAGLTNAADRAEAMGGTLVVQSRPGQGTRLTLELPV